MAFLLRQGRIVLLAIIDCIKQRRILKKSTVLDFFRNSGQFLIGIQASYDRDETDEFVKPTVVMKNGAPVATIQDGDSIIFFNFRPDRAREITRSFCDDEKGRFS